ncbi:hypothetical protein FOC4_g10000585 [Fusarium odoratissimum]|uniref:Uncharacterized protein n=1 Tax=Fusarium oxysporum f. sp. cubense (strain race 4) TaxID=2502994 RepID=N1RRP4_FUSC4|nr:hypothetical protein FOC4_g10000585 [Fusarium odoratissimum]
MENRWEKSREPPSLELAPQHQYFKSPRKVTPPEHTALPSPPATIEAERIRNSPNLPRRLLEVKCKAETCDLEPLTYIPINPAEYASASDQIESAFKRFDYEPKSGRIILRMPSPIHDKFAASLVSFIEQEILRIGRENSKVRGFTSQLHTEGSSRIFLPYEEKRENGDTIPKELRRQPDGQFRLEGAKYPGLVFEVSYSQDKKQLSKLARQYIHYTDGNIKAVICIDINYGNTQSTISLWKPRFDRDPESDDPDAFVLVIEQNIKEKPFRTAGGEPLNTGSVLTLYLHDFAPDQSCQGIPNIPISISFATICEFLERAEKAQKDRESRSTGGIRSTRKLRKRELSSSSLEDLALDDEARFKEQEEAADTRASHRDDTFVPRLGDANVIHRDRDLRWRAAKRRA